MRFAVVVLALCGCNQLLELHDVETADVDTDRDGARDSKDNCKGIANPGQDDTDGDGIGDACDLFACAEPGLSLNRDADTDGLDDGCDGCLRGGPDDEDGDGIADACDVCPAIADATQVDSDADNVGDACDLHRDTRQERAFFDGFGSGPHGWIHPTWTVADGTLTGPPTTYPVLMKNGAVYDMSWSVELAVELPQTAMQDDGIWIYLQDQNQYASVCGVRYHETTAAFELDASGVPAPLFTGKPALLPPGSIVTIRLLPETKETWRCELAGGPASVVMQQGPFKVRLGLRSPLAKVRYVDIVR